MKTLLLFIALILVIGFFSCANMFNGMVLPNQCKKCAVVNNFNDTLFQNQGCGSENTRLEEEAKIQAYDLSRTGNNMCNLEVVCESWRKDPEEE